MRVCQQHRVVKVFLLICSNNVIQIASLFHCLYKLTNHAMGNDHWTVKTTTYQCSPRNMKWFRQNMCTGLINKSFTFFLSKIIILIYQDSARELDVCVLNFDYQCMTSREWIGRHVLLSHCLMTLTIGLHKSNYHNTDEKELSEISPRLYMQPSLKDTCTRVVIMNKR